jgi:hypothetical protein
MRETDQYHILDAEFGLLIDVDTNKSILYTIYEEDENISYTCFEHVYNIFENIYKFLYRTIKRK